MFIACLILICSLSFILVLYYFKINKDYNIQNNKNNNNNNIDIEKIIKNKNNNRLINNDLLSCLLLCQNNFNQQIQHHNIVDNIDNLNSIIDCSVDCSMNDYMYQHDVNNPCGIMFNQTDNDINNIGNSFGSNF